MPNEKYAKLVAANAVLDDDRFLAAFRPTTSDDREVAMNLSLMAADMAGIVDAVLTNRALPYEHKAILQQEVLRGTCLQLCLLKPEADAATEIDLSGLPDILAYARKVENLRKACCEIVFGTTH